MKSRVASRWVARLAAKQKVVYVGVFLPPEERQWLLKKFPPVHSVTQADHLTVWFHTWGVPIDLSSLNFGERVPLKVIGYAEDGQAQAVLVQPPAGLSPHARVPHITISTAPGVQPIYSNILVKADPKRVAPFTLRGRLGWWDGNSPVFEKPVL